MTPDEALDAVKKAVGLLPRIDCDGATIWQPDISVILTALRAIAPDGPLVAVPREPTEAMIRAGHNQIDWCRDGQNTTYPRHGSQKKEFGGNLVGTFCEDDIRDAYRAMIAEGEK